MPQAQNKQQPKKLADRYRVDAPIGKGAHASTWRGWDERLDRPVAIKMLHNHLAQDPVFVQRFQAEAKVAASVRQGNVVDVYDFGQQDGTLYIIMQFVDGEDLKALITRSAPLPVRDIRRIIGNVLDGLQAIHAAGIVHRDIKPQNVLIGKDGVARVADFGVADVQSTAGLTGEGLTIGTVDYMAPEQAQGLALTPAADLYSTGVVLYEMLTGTLPHQGNTSRETMMQHINGQLIPPSLRLPNRGISPQMDAVIGQSLAKDPARRFGSARAMKQAVGQSLSGQNMNATSQATSMMAEQRPVPTPPMLQQTSYQPPAVDEDAGAGLNSAFKGIIFLLLIGALGIALWGAYLLADGDRIELPSFLNQDQEQSEPTPTVPPAPTNSGVPEEPAPIEPMDNEVIEPEQPDVAPTEVVPTVIPEIVIPPTDVPAEPTAPPAETEPPADVAPIEPIEPDGQNPVPTDEPVIDPAG